MAGNARRGGPPRQSRGRQPASRAQPARGQAARAKPTGRKATGAQGTRAKAAAKPQGTGRAKPARAQSARAKPTRATKSRSAPGDTRAKARSGTGGSGRSTKPAPRSGRAAAPKVRRSRTATDHGARGPAARSRRRVPKLPVKKPPRIVRLADPKRRLRVSLLGVCVLLSLFGGRLVQLQGLDASSYAAEAQQIGLTPVTIPAQRGDILDRNGAELASTVEAYHVTVDQTQVRNPAAYALQLERVLGIDAATLQRTLTGTDRFRYVAKSVPGAVWRQVKALRLPGLYAQNAAAREYPAGPVGGNVVGVLGADGAGLTGLEQSLDQTLAGVDGQATYQYSPGGQRIPTSAANSIQEPVAGTGLQLTIDRDIQWFAERALTDAVSHAGADDGVAVVMDVRTQEILAMASTPAFDPNRPGATEAADRGSKAVEAAYEPGSVFKPITAAVLVAEGVADASTVFSVPDRLARGAEVIHDYYTHGTEQMTLAGILAKSSNVGTVMAAEQVDKGVFADYVRRFGFGSRPGLGLPAETGGIVPAQWSDFRRDTIAFGQGISVSAIQMASAYATIANGGVRVPPKLVAATIGPDGTRVPTEAGAASQVLSPEAAAEVTAMMEAVMGPGGTGQRAQVDGYRVAGKTGTAQRVDPACGCYADYNSSFMGFAPADDPRYVVVVSLFNSRNGNSGGALAGPAFADIMRFTLQREGVAPTGAQPPELPLFAE